jgi:5-methylthioadenosine/S-adenosylhomocysteine deaminase
MKCDILIKDCLMLSPDFTFRPDTWVAIVGNKIDTIGSQKEVEAKFPEAVETISGKGKLLMPGFVDGHTHTCQQLLRGRVANEYPMVWTRFLVPFESNLEEDDSYYSAKLACAEMIRAGTTSFADAGGRNMHRVADAVIESGMRAAITKSTMDMCNVIADSMKETAQEAIAHTEELYRAYNGAGNGRVKIWFGIRQVMTCSPELIRMVAEKAREYHTGIHAHLCEHKDEVSFCLQNYKVRPAEFLDQMGALGPNLLTAHNVALSERDITLLKERDVKLIHCPSGNLSSHGFPKTPRILEVGIKVGMGSDGAAFSNLNLFDEMKVFRYAIHAYWGFPIFDPVCITSKDLMRMVTAGGAAAIGCEDTLGAVEEGRIADLILMDITGPHMGPTHNLLNTVTESANARDIVDSIIDGKVVMKNRELLTIDEEKVMAECVQRHAAIRKRANF